MNGTRTPWPGGRAISRELATMVLLALFLAALGPFGMYEEPGGRRTIQWLVFILGGYLFFRPVLAGGFALAAATRLPPVVAIACACALASLPTTLLVAATVTGWRLRGLAAGALIDLYPQVLLVGAVASVILYLFRWGRAAAAGPPAPPAPVAEAMSAAPAELSDPRSPPPASFLARIPPALGDELLCIENEDHYLRVHTALGSTLILMRLRDAVAELGAIDGLRVHRGWWVARGAVAEVVRRDRAIGLRLTNGLEVPVARSSVPELRAAGWLA